MRRARDGDLSKKRSDATALSNPRIGLRWLCLRQLAGAGVVDRGSWMVVRGSWGQVFPAFGFRLSALVTIHDPRSTNLPTSFILHCPSTESSLGYLEVPVPVEGRLLAGAAGVVSEKPQILMTPSFLNTAVANIDPSALKARRNSPSVPVSNVC